MTKQKRDELKPLPSDPVLRSMALEARGRLDEDPIFRATVDAIEGAADAEDARLATATLLHYLTTWGPGGRARELELELLEARRELSQLRGAALLQAE